MVVWLRFRLTGVDASRRGVGLLSDLQAAVILSAAMPIFTIYTVFAMDYGREGVASLALLRTTVAAFVTLTVLLGVLI